MVVELCRTEEDVFHHIITNLSLTSRAYWRNGGHIEHTVTQKKYTQIC